MENKLRGFSAINTDSEIDQVAIEYKLKMIAFQNEIFQARKRLSESDYRISRISEEMDNYLRNKENQLAEVMLTARMNAQRIQVQALSQVEHYLREMESESQSKHKDLEMFEKKATEKGITLNDMRDAKVSRDKAERLTVVKDNGRESKSIIQKAVTEPDQSPAVQMDRPEVTPLTEFPGVGKIEVGTNSGEDLQQLEILRDEVIPAADGNQAVADTNDRALTKKRKVVGKKAKKSGLDKPQAVIDESEDFAVEIQAPSSVSKPETINEQMTVVESRDYEPKQNQNLAEVIKQPPAPTVPDETMRLDAFLDVRYYDSAIGSKDIQHHALQITVDVEVPEDTYAVRYTKVNSDIVSALLRYDNVVLNEVFPFDFIAPNPQSISTYFYNYLEDILSMMDLGLQSITVLEIPDLRIQVTSRNKILDNMMHKDTDEFINLRETLRPCVEAETEDNPDLKERLNRLFKKRN